MIASWIGLFFPGARTTARFGERGFESFGGRDVSRRGAPAKRGALSWSDQWQVAHLQSPAHNIATPAGAPLAGRPSQLANPNLLLHDFLQERWKGLTPILWGQQLKQERLDELIYLHLMNADHLPTNGQTSPLSEFWHFDTTPQ